MVVCRRAVEVEQLPAELAVMLMSDLHIGASCVDYDLLERDLKRARDHNALVLLNGDVFDLILPSDRKRYDPRALHPALQNRADVINASLDLAESILAPYADLIAMVGIGNHETASERHHSVDIGALLVERLNARGGQVQYAGIGGRFRISFKYGNREGISYTIRYHHGAGGSSPVTKGLIDFARFSAWCEGYDCLWIGHKHNRFVDSAVKERSTYTEIYAHPVLHVMSGGYFVGDVQTPDEALAGRRSSYAQDVNLAPQRTGGVLLLLHVGKSGDKIRHLHVTAEALL